MKRLPILCVPVLVAVLCTPTGAGTKDETIPLKTLQQEFAVLKEKMEKHRGTVTAVATTKETGQWANNPYLSQPDTCRIKRVMIFTISKVQSGPMIHDPAEKHCMVLFERIFNRNNAGPPLVAPLPKSSRTVTLRYRLTVEDGELKYRFAPVTTKAGKIDPKQPGIVDGGFRPVELTPETKAACAAAIKKMKLLKVARKAKPANTMTEAKELIRRNINIASPLSVLNRSRACVEYEGWFLISRLDTANEDDGSFKSGMAVKKATTEIYDWK